MGRRPLFGDQAMMPAQDRARCDQAMPPQHLRQPADEGGEDPRSAQSRRGFGLALRSTATSWHSTRSSMFLDAGERPSNNSRFSSRRKTR
jgi:hypothetical protein